MGNLKTNQRGVAILMVLATVSILSYIIADFTFEIKLNKIRNRNLQDKYQARLNAEAGLQFAIAKLKIYQIAFNILQKNPDLAKVFGPDKLQALITSPFAYPPPIPKNANLITKDAINKLIESVLLRGTMIVEMSSVSGFLNPNTLRIPFKDDSGDYGQPSSSAANEPESTSTTPPHKYIEQKLIESLTQSLESKKEQDEDFDTIYGDVEPEQLIKELKFYVNDKEALEDTASVESDYVSNNITPKHAPLTSISELYLLLNWNDALVDLIKDRLSVHNVSIIQVNEITEAQLKVIFPDIEKEHITNFFEYRDGKEATGDNESKDPHPFSSEADFKEAVIGKLFIVDEETYTQRMKELSNAGLSIGVAGQLFKIISTGVVNEISYKIVAYVDLPKKPPPPKPTPKPPPPPEPNDPLEPPQEPPPPPPPDEDPNQPPIQLLLPRIREIII
ncbi:MAG: hypothetical protein ISR65_06195 [Bacteriovoracaceae bacterium]|nr:hypothetical protein [Bacteriovoracaceae bacterium]